MAHEAGDSQRARWPHRCGYGPLARLLLVSSALVLWLLGAGPVRAQTPLGNLGASDEREALDTSEEIVYIDGVGYIRVYDRVHTGGGQIVTWHSEESGWQDFTLGDFDGDGDDEIAAIRTDGDVGRLVIFDPVVATGDVIPGQRVDGIPWKVICDRTIEGAPTRVATGEFDGAVPGDELVVGATTPADDDDGFGPYLVSLWHRTGGTAACPWSMMFEPREFGNSWTVIATGNLDHVGVDDVIFLDDDESILEVYRIDNGLDPETDRILDIESENKKWTDVAPGRYQTTLEQLAAVRSVPLGLPSMMIMQYRNVDETWVDTYTQQFVPSPRFVFRADLDGNDDDEVFMLREVPSNVNSPRIFMRNPAGAALPPFEQPLDTDNGFRAGAAGDVDGDGKDEIAIIRSLQLRLYLDPDSLTESIRYAFEGYATSTNSRSIQMGDLDGNGYIGQPYLLATPSRLDVTLVEGQVSEPYPIVITDPIADLPLDFTVAVEGNPRWLSVTPTSGTTPQTLFVTIDGTQLLPGTYATSLNLATENADTLTNTTRAGVFLTVTPGIFASPSDVTVLSSCRADATPVSLSVDVLGTAGETFTAGLEAPDGVAPAWVTVAPVTGTIPATLMLTVDPALRPSGAPKAALLVEQDADGTVVRVPIALFCVDARVWLPLILAE